MKPVNRRTLKVITGAAIMAFVSLLGSSALTASNTVPESKAGDGANDITGYEVTDVDYTLAANPQNIDSVSFVLDSIPSANSEIQVRLATGGSWYACTSDDEDVTCDTSNPVITVAAADELRVIAVD